MSVLPDPLELAVLRACRLGRQIEAASDGKVVAAGVAGHVYPGGITVVHLEIHGDADAVVDALVTVGADDSRVLWKRLSATLVTAETSLDGVHVLALFASGVPAWVESRLAQTVAA